jgi:hypothetical protein
MAHTNDYFRMEIRAGLKLRNHPNPRTRDVNRARVRYNLQKLRERLERERRFLADLKSEFSY